MEGWGVYGQKNTEIFFLQFSAMPKLLGRSLSGLEVLCTAAGMEAESHGAGSGRRRLFQRCTRTLSSFPTVSKATGEGVWQDKLYLWQQ